MSVELVRKAQNGSQTAFGELYVSYKGLVINTVRRVLRGRIVDEDDLVQDVFILAYEKLDTLKAPEAWVKWLKAIARRSAINTISRDKYTLKEALLNEGIIDLMCPIEDTNKVLQNEEREIVLEAMNMFVSPAARETALLFYFQGKTQEEVAKEQGIPINTVKSRLSRTKSLIKPYLENKICGW